MGKQPGTALLPGFGASPGLRRGCAAPLAVLGSRVGKLETQNISFSVERSTTTVNYRVAELTWPWLNKGIIQSRMTQLQAGDRVIFVFLKKTPNLLLQGIEVLDDSTLQL